MSWYFQVVWVLFYFPCLPQLECELHEGREMEWLTPQVPQRLVGTNHENHREHLRLLSAGHVQHCWERAGNTGPVTLAAALQDVRCPHPLLHVRSQATETASDQPKCK